MRRVALALVAAVVAAALLVPTGLARLLPPGAQPMQLSYQLWGVTWVKHAFQRSPLARTSLLAVRGNKCGLAYGKAWLLPTQANGTTVVAHCTIPAGKLLVFAADGSVQLAGSEQALRARVASDLRGISDVQASFDGVSLPIREHLISTPLILLNLPEHNLFQIPPGTYDAVASGWVGILSPPSRGTHTLSWSSIESGPEGSHHVGMTIHLTIR